MATPQANKGSTSKGAASSLNVTDDNGSGTNAAAGTDDSPHSSPLKRPASPEGGVAQGGKQPSPDLRDGQRKKPANLSVGDVAVSFGSVMPPMPGAILVMPGVAPQQPTGFSTTNGKAFPSLAVGPQALAQQKKVSQAGRRIRVSITFKVAPGWRGTKSRDFPGRHFDSGARDLLQSWANEFRRGMTVVQPVMEADTRTVRLPDSQAAKRRKPYMGVSLIHRADAFHWFRATQERLMDNFCRKEGTLDQEPVSFGIRAFFPNVYTCGHSIDSPPSPDIPKDVQDNIAGVPPEVRKHWPETMHMRLGEFIEVKWDENTEKKLLMEDKNTHRFRVYIKFNDISVPVNIMEGGRGSFIRAANLPPGVYTVNGAKLTVIKSQTGKKGKRKRSSSKSLPPTKARKAGTTDVGTSSQMRDNMMNSASHGQLTDSMQGGVAAPLHHANIAGPSHTHPVPQDYRGVMGGMSTAEGMVQARIKAEQHMLHHNYYMSHMQTSQQPQKRFQMPAMGGNPYLSQLGVTLYEVSLISKMRKLLAPIITTLPYCQWPEIVGDVALLRFLRSAHHDADVAAVLFREHIQARQRYGFDSARERVSRSLAHYPPMAQSSSSPWTHFSQDMLIHGELFRSQMCILPVADVTPSGDPVQLIFVHDLSEAICRPEFVEFLAELIVRRQIATDIMTMQQGRIVETVTVGGGSIDPGTMARLAGIILDLRAQFRAAVISNSGTPLFNAAGNGTPSGIPGMGIEDVNTKVESESGEPRRGTFMLHKFSPKEIAIEVDCSKVYKVGWSFNVLHNMEVDFEISLVLEAPAAAGHNRQVKSEAGKEAMTDELLGLVERPYIQKRRLCSDSGLVDFSDSSNIDHAYIVFRWSSPETTSQNIGWSNINQIANPSQSSTTSYQVRSETEGGALVGAVLGLGTRMESIRKLQMSKARGDVLQLFGGINARLQQRHIEDFEDAMHNLQLILKSFEEIVAGLRSCADDAAQLMATVQSDPAIEAEPAVLLRVAFAPPTLARPVPLEALVRYTRDLTREYAHEYWRKLDLVASVRYTNLSMLETLTNEWSTSSISSPFNTDLVDALTLTLASVVQ
eukprot:g3949.t1